METTYKRVALTDIRMGDNPRKHVGDTTDLQDSIKALGRGVEGWGLVQPITLRPDVDGKYVLVSGRRRFTACKTLGWKEIPANILDGEWATEDGESDTAGVLAAMVASNAYREPAPSENAALIVELAATHQWSLPKIRRALGMPLEKVRLLAMLHTADPQIKARVDAGRMSLSAFKVIADESPDTQRAHVTEAERNVRNAEKKVTARVLKDSVARSKPAPAALPIGMTSSEVMEAMTVIKAKAANVLESAPFASNLAMRVDYVLEEVEMIIACIRERIDNDN